MKRIILVLLLFLLTTTLYSQEKGTMDFSVSAGVISSNFLIDFYAQLLTLGLIRTKGDVMTPAINTTFKYAVMDNWFVNADFTYEYAKKKLLGSNDEVLDIQTHNYFTLGIGTEYHYFNTEITRIYAGTAIAYTLDNYKTNSQSANVPHFNFQLTPLGIRVGKKLAGFFELGFGYKGILILGISYQH